MSVPMVANTFIQIYFKPFVPAAKAEGAEPSIDSQYDTLKENIKSYFMIDHLLINLYILKEYHGFIYQISDEKDGFATLPWLNKEIMKLHVLRDNMLAGKAAKTEAEATINSTTQSLNKIKNELMFRCPPYHMVHTYFRQAGNALNQLNGEADRIFNGNYNKESVVDVAHQLLEQSYKAVLLKMIRELDLILLDVNTFASNEDAERVNQLRKETLYWITTPGIGEIKMYILQREVDKIRKEITEIWGRLGITNLDLAPVKEEPVQAPAARPSAPPPMRPITPVVPAAKMPQPATPLYIRGQKFNEYVAGVESQSTALKSISFCWFSDKEMSNNKDSLEFKVIEYDKFGRVTGEYFIHHLIKYNSKPGQEGYALVETSDARPYSERVEAVRRGFGKLWHAMHLPIRSRAEKEWDAFLSQISIEFTNTVTGH